MRFFKSPLFVSCLIHSGHCGPAPASVTNWTSASAKLQFGRIAFPVVPVDVRGRIDLGPLRTQAVRHPMCASKNASLSEKHKINHNSTNTYYLQYLSIFYHELHFWIPVATLEAKVGINTKPYKQ